MTGAKDGSDGLVVLSGAVAVVDVRRTHQGNAWAQVTLAAGGGDAAVVDVLPALYLRDGRLLVAGARVRIGAKSNDWPGAAPFTAFTISAAAADRDGGA